VNISPTKGNRNTEILLLDPAAAGVNLSASKVFYFHAGIWKQLGQGDTAHDDDILAPNFDFIVRHNVATSTTLAIAGLVQNNPLAVTLQSSITNQQDNFIGLTWPAPLTLNNSQLISSGAFAPSPVPGARTDELLTFDNATALKNKSSTAVFYYWSNGWRRVGSGSTDVGDTAVFQPGTGVIIRKATNSPAAVWTTTPNW
jgi:uncharacterized protein (TIGR02597 family)